MKSSEQIGELTQALSKLQGEINDARRDVQGHGYNYADLSQCLMIARPLLAKHDLALIQTISNQNDLIGVTTVISHSSGQWLSDSAYLPLDIQLSRQGKPLMTQAQAAGATTTYLRRYMLCSFLAITQSDNDAAGIQHVDTYASPANDRPAANDQPISEQQSERLANLICDNKINASGFCNYYNVDRIEQLPASRYDDALSMIKNSIAKRKEVSGDR